MFPLSFYKPKFKQNFRQTENLPSQVVNHLLPGTRAAPTATSGSAPDADLGKFRANASPQCP